MRTLRSWVVKAAQPKNGAPELGAAPIARTYRCDLEVWADAAGSRNEVEVQKLRTRILAQAADVTKDIGDGGERELDKYADSAAFCAVAGAEPNRCAS